MPTKDEPESELPASIVELAAELGEHGLDSFLDDGVLKDIPLLGTLVRAYKTGKDVRQYLFARKVSKFVTQLPDFSEEEIDQFNDEIEYDADLRQRLSEHLTLLLDRLDDIEKCDMLAKAFSSYVKQKISFDEFRRIARAIEQCMIDDLREVHNFDHANDAYPEITYSLAACGLVELVSLPLVQGPEAHSIYKITEFGELFVREVLA